eukprot:COSAG01_NODE_21296_length_908_cov_7.457355_1_plen_151_part_00
MGCCMTGKPPHQSSRPNPRVPFGCDCSDLLQSLHWRSDANGFAALGPTPTLPTCHRRFSARGVPGSTGDAELAVQFLNALRGLACGAHSHTLARGSPVRIPVTYRCFAAQSDHHAAACRTSPASPEGSQWNPATLEIQYSTVYRVQSYYL